MLKPSALSSCLAALLVALSPTAARAQDRAGSVTLSTLSRRRVLRRMFGELPESGMFKRNTLVSMLALLFALLAFVPAPSVDAESGLLGEMAAVEMCCDECSGEEAPGEPCCPEEECCAACIGCCKRAAQSGQVVQLSDDRRVSLMHVEGEAPPRGGPACAVWHPPQG